MSSAARGSVALVTGGSSGIGRATAATLAEAGFRVISAARRTHTPPPGGSTWRTDLSEPGAAAALVADAVSAHGRLDVLVANAGAMRLDDVLAADPEDWAAMVSVNLAAATELARAALPHLLAAASSSRGVADVVFVGSTSARVPLPGRSVYAATKAAVRSFADVLRLELAPTAVRVALVEPGLTATGLRDHLDSDRPARMDGVTPLRPEAVAATIGWLVQRPADVSVAELVVLPTGQGR